MLYPLSSDEVIGKIRDQFGENWFTKLPQGGFRGLSKRKNRLSKDKLRVGFAFLGIRIPISNNYNNVEQLKQQFKLFRLLTVVYVVWKKCADANWGL